MDHLGLDHKWHFLSRLDSSHSLLRLQTPHGKEDRVSVRATTVDRCTDPHRALGSLSWLERAKNDKTHLYCAPVALVTLTFTALGAVGLPQDHTHFQAILNAVPNLHAFALHCHFLLRRHR